MDNELEHLVDEIEKDAAGTDVSEDDESSEGEEKNHSRKVGTDKQVKLFEERYFEVDDEPPKLVVIQGPPGSGKTTLIKSLVRHYTKQTIVDPKGSRGVTDRPDHRQDRQEAENHFTGVSQRHGVDGRPRERG